MNSTSYSMSLTTLLLVSFIYSAFSLIALDLGSTAFLLALGRTALLAATFWMSLRRIGWAPTWHYLTGFAAGIVITVWVGGLGGQKQGFVLLLCGAGIIWLMLRPIFEALGSVMRGRDKGV